MKRSPLLIFKILSVLLAWSPSSSFGAACCGGSLSLPSVITTDDKAQFAATYTHSQVVVDSVDSNGFWRTWDTHQQVETFQLDGAHLLSDRWQAGAHLPFIQRSEFNQTFSGLGDAAVSAAYEYLPDWNYNIFRPHGIGFFQITLPTGKSKYESDIGGLDSRGNGLFALGAGTLLTKTIHRYDFLTFFEIHRSFDKSFSTSQMTGTLHPGFGGNLGVGGGYNLGPFRGGSTLTWSYEDPVNITGTDNIAGSVERYATFGASVSYLESEEWSATFSYTDQTLFGSPINTSLGRGIALQLARRWPR